MQHNDKNVLFLKKHTDPMIWRVPTTHQALTHAQNSVNSRRLLRTPVVIVLAVYSLINPLKMKRICFL
jgi:hypothetical protein